MPYRQVLLAVESLSTENELLRQKVIDLETSLLQMEDHITRLCRAVAEDNRQLASDLVRHILIDLNVRDKERRRKGLRSSGKIAAITASMSPSVHPSLHPADHSLRKKPT